MPLRHNARVLDILEMRGGAVVMSVVNTEAPPAVLPQGAIPFGMVRFFVATLETVGEGGALSLLFALVLGYGMQLKAIFAFNVTPLVFWWPLCCMDAWEER